MSSRKIKTKYSTTDEGMRAKKLDALKKASISKKPSIQERIDKNADKILSTIRAHTVYGGIGISDLAKVVDMSRFSIPKYTRDLEAKGLIIKKNSLFVSTDKSLLKFINISKSKSYELKNQFLTSFDSMSILYNYDSISKLELEPRVIRNLFDEEYERYLIKFGPEDRLEKLLFEFSNKLGAFILFLFIYWMNPIHYTNKLTQRKEREQVMFGILQKTIREMMKINNNSIYTNFCNLVLQSGNYNHEETNAIYNLIFPSDQESHHRFERAFSRIYPKFAIEMQKISGTGYIDDIPRIRKKSTLNMAIMRDMDHIDLVNIQDSCNHRYTRHGKNSSKKFVKCSLCDKIATAEEATDWIHNKEKKQNRKKKVK